jgi:ribosome biogenesis GTPase A
MSIHWFPGHMATARREIRKTMPQVDFVLEVLDARLPYSSENPLVAELLGGKPRIQILNKSDLADPEVTARWLPAIAAVPGTHPLVHHHEQRGLRERVTTLARGLVAEAAPSRGGRSGPLAALILGIPNVGKSTLVNRLAGRVIAKASNKPAVTQQQQRVQVGSDLVLFDTPGFLWPKLTPASCGYRLAVSGAISDRVVDLQDVAGFAARFLLSRYPAATLAFYGLDAAPVDETALIEAVGRRRGMLVKGGVVDLQRAAERLIHDLRDGKIGPISFETPEDRA